MSLLRINPLCAADLDAIWDFISQDDSNAADAFIVRLWKNFELLAENPRIGRKQDDLSEGARSSPEGNYIIYYTLLDDGAEILRVLHGAMDQRKAFRKRKQPRK